MNTGEASSERINNHGIDLIVPEPGARTVGVDNRALC